MICLSFEVKNNYQNNWQTNMNQNYCILGGLLLLFIIVIFIRNYQSNAQCLTQSARVHHQLYDKNEKENCITPNTIIEYKGRLFDCNNCKLYKGNCFEAGNPCKICACQGKGFCQFDDHGYNSKSRLCGSQFRSFPPKHQEQFFSDFYI